MTRVLLVDDENILLETICIYLKGKEKIYSEMCHSAIEALEILNVKKFDVIVSDYDMPEMDGIEFLKQLRNNGNDTPFILFTGRGREEVAINALNNGADYYIQKGGDVKVLFTELSSSIKKSAERYEAYKKVRHLNDIIVIIRRVKRLINEEKDFITLLRSMCDTVTQNSIYENARIVLFSKPGEIIAAEQSGFGEEFNKVLEWLAKGEMTGCAKKAISKPGIIVSEKCGVECEGCPFQSIHNNFGAITCRLERDNEIYGIFSVTLPRDLVNDKDEHLLFEILAKDISKAIHSFALEEKNLDQQVIITAKDKRHYIDNIVYHSVLNQTHKISKILGDIGKLSKKNPDLLEYIDQANISLSHIDFDLKFTRDYQEMGKVKPEWHSVRDLTKDNNDNLKKNGFNLEIFNEDLQIFADNMISRAMDDIVNFFILNKQDSTYLKITFCETKGGCSLEFEDDGQGVPYLMKDKIFEKDYYESNKIGLYLSREILAITGISIREYGDHGYGTLIRLDIPKECFRIKEDVAYRTSPGSFQDDEKETYEKDVADNNMKYLIVGQSSIQ